MSVVRESLVRTTHDTHYLSTSPIVMLLVSEVLVRFFFFFFFFQLLLLVLLSCRVTVCKNFLHF